MSWRRTPRPSYDVMFYMPAVTPLLSQTEYVGGGAETQIVLVARALARRGIRTCLAAFPSEGELPSSLDGVDIVVRAESKAHQRRIGKLREFARIRKALDQVEARVVVTRTADAMTGCIGLAAKLRRRRFVYSSSSVLDFNFTPFAPAVQDRILYRLGMQLADGIVVQTDEQARLCQEMLGRSPVVIRSIGEGVPQRTAFPEAFIWIGRIDRNKRPLEFVELARSLPEASFWMIAIPREPQLLDEVERAAARIPNLELLAPIPRPQVLELIERAVAVVSTSEFEGMPNVFLEGWARGVPALALSHDPDGVIERHGLGGCAGGSREGFAAAARALWQGRDDQSELAGRCRRYIAEEHSEEVVAHQWEQALLLSPTVSAAVAPGRVPAC
jgi:glycosyltransferase involved in cell wall biosynthesis